MSNTYGTLGYISRGSCEKEKQELIGEFQKQLKSLRYYSGMSLMKMITKYEEKWEEKLK